MKVTITNAGLAPEFGGPSRSIPALAEALAAKGTTIRLLACESAPGHSAPVVPSVSLVRTELLPHRSRSGRWAPRQNDFFRALGRHADGPNAVIHDNGLWLPNNHAVAAASRFLGRPLLISPRGMLSAWATAHRGWKKRLAWRLFQRQDLHLASALHATSVQEAQDFRRIGYYGPIAIIPNGVALPPESPAQHRDSACRTALFLSRIHPKKGLLDLIEAWSVVQPRHWRMVIAGTDEGGHEAQLRARVAARGLQEVFEFRGPVDGGQKLALYRASDLFILPSHSENFGIVIAEALACGVPVITTHGTPWEELVQHQCGWWEPVGAPALAHALRTAVNLTDAERRSMGQRGRRLVERAYTWTHAAAEMQAVYSWLLGAGKRPDCLQD